MADKFNHKYRIPSARLQSWDYGSSALYFVTICTKYRDPHFGEIINGEIHLSEIGKIVHSEWFKTFDMRPDMNLEMDAFIIMPNHFHAIIFIGENRFNSGRDAMHCVSTGENIKNKFGRQSKNLASVIRGFKISVTTNARKINPNFAWQPRFHDHIIRNQNSLHNIQNYIINNPQKWMDDTFYI